MIYGWDFGVEIGKPIDVGGKVNNVLKDFSCFLSVQLELLGSSILLELYHRDDRHKIKVEYLIYLKPCQPDSAVFQAFPGAKFLPQIFGQKIILVFVQGLLLDLQPIFLDFLVEDILQSQNALIVGLRSFILYFI